MEVDPNKEFDLVENIVSLVSENHLLSTKVDKLEVTHRVELAVKEREIEHGKQLLKELDNQWKNREDLLRMVKEELAERQANELLRKVDKLEATHRVLKELDSRWKNREDLLHTVKDELEERQANELLRKVDKLEATHKVELEAKEREIEQGKQMLKELDGRWKSQKDLLYMVKDELAKRQVNELLRKVNKLKASHRIELEAKEREIRGLKRHLEKPGNWWKSREDLFCIMNDELAERKVNELQRKVDKLEATHKIELEAKERKIEHGKQMLKKLDNWWKNREDLLHMVKEELAERQVNEFLSKIDKLEVTHRVELEAKEREIEHGKQMLEELDNRWKTREDLLRMVKDELAERQANELLRKVEKLEATRRVELEAKGRKIEHGKHMLKELDGQWKSQKELLCMVGDELAERQVNELLRKVDKLKATHRIELEENEREIRGVKRHLEDLDSWWKSREDLFCMTNDELAERQVDELLRKVDKLEETHKIKLEAKEMEIRGLKRHLEKLDNWWKSQTNLLCMAKDELAERRINELLTKFSKLENSQKLIDENEQVGGSSDVNANN
ncbi:uncharacterized protein LOC129871046 [Solanum dulcamara]|uniref:uncharacterized protein LOC129871046 n=1 Tax=Solanum dulcamara TaxID=45834 RepID=UPI002484EE1F|nr:uncharacterized protein LOC129871046 [Solanum dulcamara]